MAAPNYANPDSLTELSTMIERTVSMAHRGLLGPTH